MSFHPSPLASHEAKTNFRRVNDEFSTKNKREKAQCYALLDTTAEISQTSHANQLTPFTTCHSSARGSSPSYPLPAGSAPRATRPPAPPVRHVSAVQCECQEW